MSAPLEIVMDAPAPPVLAKAHSTPIGGNGIVPAPTVLQRAKSDGITVTDRRARFGKIQDDDAAFPAATPDDASLAFTSCGQSSEADITSEWASIGDEVCATTDEPVVVAESSTWKCAICLSSQDGALEPERALCGQEACAEMFCKDCVTTYCLHAVEGSKFMALPVRCPGSTCKRRVATSQWSKFVPESSLDDYEDGARAILNIRCPGCHEPQFLYHDALDVDARRESMKELFSSAAANNPASIKKLRETWTDFAAGTVSADEMLDTVLLVLGHQDMSSEPWTMEQLMAQEDEDDAETSYLVRVLRNMADVERRVVFHLAALRRQPKIFTPCCRAPVCWRCKVEGHHDGATCEEIQRAELEVEVQFCPGCGVGTEKTEGCDHMVCLCGEEWEWEGGDDEEF